MLPPLENGKSRDKVAERVGVGGSQRPATQSVTATAPPFHQWNSSTKPHVCERWSFPSWFAGCFPVGTRKTTHELRRKGYYHW